jgi:hypothetical protein
VSLYQLHSCIEHRSSSLNLLSNVLFLMVRRKRDDDSSNVTFNSSSFGGSASLNGNGIGIGSPDGGIISGIFHSNSNSINYNNDNTFSPTFNNNNNLSFGAVAANSNNMDGGASIAAESQLSLAFDASSMSAAGSFGAVAGGDSRRRRDGRDRSKRRPYKRQRKTLTDALQQINLNRDVPLQILNSGPTTAIHHRSGVAGAAIAGATGGIHNCGPLSDAIDGDDSSLLVNRGTSSSGGRDIDEFDDDDDDNDEDDDDDDNYDGHHAGASGLLLGLNGAGDYDDNSQLTASDDDDDDNNDDDNDDSEVLHKMGVVIKAETETTGGGTQQTLTVDMDAADADSDDNDEDETDMSNNNMDSMTDVEKAQRKAMLDLLMGKSRTILTFTGQEKPIVSSSVSAVDRQIEDLLRKSLQNVKQGVHPLVVKPTTPLTNTDNDDDDDVSIWQTQDDMAIDPRIYNNYSRSATTAGMVTSDRNNYDDNGNNNNNYYSMLPPPVRRKRSNSLPRSMDLDSSSPEYENRQSTVMKTRSNTPNLSPPVMASTLWLPSSNSNYSMAAIATTATDQPTIIGSSSSCNVETSIGTSDIAMD